MPYILSGNPTWRLSSLSIAVVQLIVLYQCYFPGYDNCAHLCELLVFEEVE